MTSLRTGITHAVPHKHLYENLKDFDHDLIATIFEVDSVGVDEFIKRDRESGGKYSKEALAKTLKDYLEVDIHKLSFKPPQAALLTTKSERTWQRWCKNRTVKRRSNGLKWKHKHYKIPFSEIERHLKPEFIENPRLILNYVTK